MEEETETRLSELKHRIARGDYRIEPGVIADAILRRLRERDAHRGWGAELRRSARTPTAARRSR